MHPKVYAKDAGPRPPCECHGEPMYWSAKATTPAGGNWNCRALARQSRRKNAAKGREALNEYQRAWRAANRGRHAQYHRTTKYGLTAEQYRDLLVGQAGRCLICLRVPTRDLNVDHDHTTGAVRGLICGDCNRMIGLAKDNAERLRSAAAYVERYAR